MLPLEDPEDRISLGEGFTPLLAAPTLGARLGVPLAFIKEEGGNPTGSFKARGLSLAVSMAKALGATDVCLPSAGNAGSALAAYAARAGMKAHVFMPKDVARIFVMETQAYGAHVETVDGLITDAGKICAERAKEHGWYECATLKEPYRVEGKKTLGYEIAEQMGWTLPDAILYPTGGGTGLIGMWKAFEELETMGFVGPKRPRMYAIQAEGCRAHRQGVHRRRRRSPDVAQRADPRPRPPRAQGPRRLPDPAGAPPEPRTRRWRYPDEEIIAGVKDGAAAEGVFMCPEGGACVAALRKLKASGHVSPDDTVVLFNTGTGFKYIDNMVPLW